MKTAQNASSHTDTLKKTIDDLSQRNRLLEQTLSDLQTALDIEGNTAVFRGNYRTLQYEYFSPSVKNITGFSAAEIIEMGQSALTDRIDRDDFARAGKILAELFENGGGEYCCEYRFKTKNGSWKRIREKGFAFCDTDGLPLYALSTLTNAGTQRNNGTLQYDNPEHARRLESIGNITGGIVHDFNNILTAILGYTEILKIWPNDEAKHDTAIRVISEAGNRAKELVAQILSFTRRQPQRRITIQAGSLIREIRYLLKCSLRPGTALQSAGEDCELQINVDPAQIHQLLMGLAKRLQLTNHDAVCLNVGVSGRTVELTDNTTRPNHLPGAGNHVCFTVGVTQNDQHATESGYTSDMESEQNAQTQSLSSLREIAEKNGGVLLQTGGASFEVHLPLHEKTANLPGQSYPPEKITGDRHVIVIDDEPALAALAETFLLRLGCRVSNLESPADIFSRIKTQANSYFAVFTDLNMPAMSGLVLARYVREIAPGLPVILVTGHLDDDSRGKLGDSGISALLMKPYTIEQLQTVLDEIQKRRNSPENLYDVPFQLS